MISRSLTRRVEYLEQLDPRFQPVGEPTIINLQIVDEDLKVVDQMQLAVAPCPNEPFRRARHCEGKAAD
jgi:hypothetical protein